MILLLGGTADTEPIAQALARRGFSVLFSTATDYPLSMGANPLISKRQGVLDKAKLTTLVRERNVTVIVNATHPYAEVIGPLASDVAEEMDIPYLRYLRPSSLDETTSAILVPNHNEAARIACSFRKPTLLTIGSKSLAPYVAASRETGTPLIIRVLDRQESIDACLDLGLDRSRIVAARGPFSIDENTSLIRRFHIGTLVTKDSGREGGVKEKLRAARDTGCRVIVVKRPQVAKKTVYNKIPPLVDAVAGLIEKPPNL